MTGHHKTGLVIGPTVLAVAERFLTGQGSLGLEGTGLIAAQPRVDGSWQAVRFVAPDQRGQSVGRGCWVEVTEQGKRELPVCLPSGCRYMARVHSHPGEGFHSAADDRNPALTHEGALSVVVPYFGLGLRRGLDACAVFRLNAGTWVELPVGALRDRWVMADG